MAMGVNIILRKHRIEDIDISIRRIMINIIISTERILLDPLIRVIYKDV